MWKGSYMMRVELITHTPEPEKVVATAAKLCYSSSDIASLREGLTEEKTKSFIEMARVYWSRKPYGTRFFYFWHRGDIPCLLLIRLVRHRIVSYSQKSQRYVSESGFEFITPPSIEAVPEAKAEFDQANGSAT